MSRWLSIRHRIEIDHGEPTEIPTHWARLRPAPGVAHRIRAYTMQLDPPATFVNWVRDPLQNHLARIDLPEPTTRLAIDVEIVAELEPANPFDFLLEPGVGQYPFEYSPSLRRDLAPYLSVPPNSPAFQKWSAALDRQPAYVIERLTAAAREIGKAITIDQSSTRGAVDLEATLSTRNASPWALAWLLTLSLRSLGFAARFVSGYVVGHGAPAIPVDLRAWTDVFLPGAGWIGIDPLTQLLVGESYIPLAAAPDPRRAQPLVAARELPGACRAEDLRGRTIDRVDRAVPCTRSQRREIDQVTPALDTNLGEAGLRLSVQRDIAVVSATERDAPEWTSVALGDDKLSKARTLLHRLRECFDPAGVPMNAQGRWYAGEPLPRWKLLCVFRADGVPLWHQEDTATADRPALSIADVKACAEEITRRLGVAASLLRPAYDDPLFESWHSTTALRRRRPGEDLADPARRQRLTERLCASASPVGYVLPLHRDSAAGWRSGRWDLRRGEIYVSPGESALGLRLPLDSLPPPVRPKDRKDPKDGKEGESATAAADDVPRTALCFELREGHLHIFLPPIDDFARFVDLISTIDAVLTQLALSAALEGYEPPDDTRLRRVVIEPDIGVLRVAVPESDSWAKHAELLHVVYDGCAQVGLEAHRLSEHGERVPLCSCAPLSMRGGDGLDNPFLRRPDLLRRLIQCWQSHPSLSYLFATRPLEPDGGSVRATDARIGAAYELALGLERLGSTTGEQPGRVLQYLLTDSKLDPRNAEIRVDEITGAEEREAAHGRVILRSFDTPPNASMAALQAALVAALLACSGQTTGSVEASSASRDRFLLPHPLWDDLCLLLTEIEPAGYRLRPEWFRPFLDFHFPVLGEVRLGDLALELRKAHEPQPVLAEEIVDGGPVRFVDVANERIQVRATGLTLVRHALVCNGRLVPLQRTRTPGELICGIRFKALNPPFTLHPTIPPVGELVLDLVDLWSRKRLGGCTYRPAAQGTTARPDQARTAVDLEPRAPTIVGQSQRAGRFLTHGSTADAPFEIPAETGEAYVLDLTGVR